MPAAAHPVGTAAEMAAVAGAVAAIETTAVDAAAAGEGCFVVVPTGVAAFVAAIPAVRLRAARLPGACVPAPGVPRFAPRFAMATFVTPGFLVPGFAMAGFAMAGGFMPSAMIVRFRHDGRRHGDIHQTRQRQACQAAMRARSRLRLSHTDTPKLPI